jgi:hypothetical protein
VTTGRWVWQRLAMEISDGANSYDKRIGLSAR